ncbi:DUF805 domain-containing protein [Lichenibacterium minor]|uniref:DUF805 domain-containing protein n=1 Tax=Lichenibacterium minor TaxID=2316528 RepID=A0A4Q2U142_9HYPH|nr:DUF805 domain-containing protein [Lichenibacterium minor]RYC29388.1 DUF805 domain-containing protein [Lichenibacterium minor]
MSSTPDHPAHPHDLDEGWFYHRGGVEHGPLSRESLAEALRLMPSIGVLVWHASLPDWASPAEPQVRTSIHGAPPAPERPRGLLALLFSFDGRIGRTRYFWTYCLGIASYIVGLMAVLLYARMPIDSETGVLIRLALAPPFVWIGLALTAKRLHDFDMSATHLVWIEPVTMAGFVVPPGALSNALSVASGLVGTWLIIKRGTPGPNRYGRSLVGGVRSVSVPVAASPTGWSINVPTVLAILAIAGTMLIYGGRAIQTLRPSASLCSDPGVLTILRDLVEKDPSMIIIGAYYGSFANIRISFHDIRTMDAFNPVRGSTCVAMTHVSAIDKSKAGVGDRDLSDIGYTAQYVDGSNTRYVVSLVN